MRSINKLSLFSIIGLISVVFGQNYNYDPNSFAYNASEVNFNVEYPTVSGEEIVNALSELGRAISGRAIPFEAAQRVIPALENMRMYTDFSVFADLLELDLETRQRIFDQYLLRVAYAEQRAQYEVDKTFKLIFDDQCYQQFIQSEFEIYTAQIRYIEQLTNFNQLSALEQQYASLERYCLDTPNLRTYVENIANMINGVGDCDALQALYDGDVEYNIWAGWRDNIDDKAAYLITVLSAGIAVLNSCAQYTNETDLDRFTEYYQNAIDRTLQFDQKAYNSLQDTVRTNLEQMLPMASGLILPSVALNVNGNMLARIYNDYLWQMGLTYTNVSTDEFYVECSNCVTLNSGGYYVLSNWLPRNSTANVNTQEVLDSLEFSNDVTKEEIAAQIWRALGDCNDGVAVFNNDFPAYINSYLGDRLAFRMTDTITILVWGSQESCPGRPSSPASFD